MKVLVAGTGSIGKRHIANLQKLGADVSAYSYRAAENPGNTPHSALRLVSTLQSALQSDFDAIVIANRTDLHMPLAIEAARAKKHLFIEKPLADSLQGAAELLALATENKLVVETGFMLRCHPNLLWMQQALATNSIGELMHCRASVGQWLPDWRPGTDHRLGYGAFRKGGGGVIFDLIHELDLVCWLIGNVVDVSAMTRYVRALEIETEAIAQIGLRFDSGVLAQVHLDYIRPGYGRDLEIIGTQGVLSWRYTDGTVSLTKSDGTTEIVHRVPAGFERNHMFEDHMRHFLARVADPTLPAISSLHDGIAALRVALATHQSAEERRNIRPDEVTHHFEPSERFAP